MKDHAREVLAGIIPDRRDHLLYAMQHLETDHFREEAERNIFVMLERYYNAAAGVLPRNTLTDLLERSNVDAAKSLLYEELFDEIAGMVVADHEFRYAVDALKDLRAEQMTGEAITAAYEILERGAEVNGTTMQGHKEAREYAYGEFAKIDHLNHVEAAPEGDMRHEVQDVLQEYADIKSGKIGQGVLTGIETIDNATGGFRNGELCLICAYTGQGKSMLTTQTAWHAAVQQGVNVFFATSETVRSTVRRRIIARHSRLPQFENPRGLNSTKIKNGALDPKEEEIFHAVVHDLDTNPNYGKIYIAQIPRGATLAFMEARFARQAVQWDVGLCVVDYLALLKPERNRTNEREEFNAILRDGKTFAVSANEGKGVPFVSPWQIKQTEYKEAMKTGTYGLASLSDTSEAEKSSDQIISILRMPETPKRATLQFLKMRDGDTPQPVDVETDYRSTYIGDQESGGDDMDLDSLMSM